MYLLVFFGKVLNVMGMFCMGAMARHLKVIVSPLNWLNGNIRGHYSSSLCLDVLPGPIIVKLRNRRNITLSTLTRMG